MIQHFRNTWAEVDLEAIGYNIRQIKAGLPKNCAVIAVVKADAYGHGAEATAKKALHTGADMLAVALLEEALRLREAGISAPILIFGQVRPRDVSIAVEHDLILTCFQSEWIREVDKLGLSSPVKVHMNWDTGMGRTGLRTHAELQSVIDALYRSDSVQLTGIYTHFATADEAGRAYLNAQQNHFEQLLKHFKDIWHEPVMIHTGNSAASMRFPEEMYDAVRFGISMYGLFPSDTVKTECFLDLKPAFSLHSRLTDVKSIEAGESISYGASYTASDQEYIGTIPIGYADGWARKLQGMDVLIAGKRMPIIGKITMDQTMIKLDKYYSPGTQVTLIGSNANECIDANEVAAKLDTINYEVPCMISARVPRIYK